MAELGPGNSVGIGLAALLSGADCYFGLDAVAHTDLSSNLQVLDGLIELFQSAAPIPDANEFPGLEPQLLQNEFPHDLIDRVALKRALEASRLDELRQGLRNPLDRGSPLRYIAPWSDPQALAPGSIDFLLSQAVLEHVDNLPAVYSAMYQWLADDGILSHQIDYSSHGLSVHWDGHRACPDWLWYLLRGKRPYLLNRAPHSAQIEHLERAGFEVIHQECVVGAMALPRERLSHRFRGLSERDRKISSAFVQARKHSALLPECGRTG